jgi:capsular exopolysaccharide synthesis family protein
MKPKPDVHALLANKNGGQSEQFSALIADELDESKGQGINFRPLLRMVRRNLFLIAGITALVTTAALYKSFKVSHSYAGTFRILVEPLTADAQKTDPGQLSGNEKGGNNTLDYPTLLQIIQSPGLLTKIAKEVQTRYPDVTYDLLKKDLLVQRVGTNMLDFTKLIEVQYTGEDPVEVEFILRKLANGYLRYSLDDRKSNIGGGVKFIDEQLPRLRQQVSSLQEEMLGLLQRNNLSDPTSDRAELSRQLREIQARKQQTLLDLQEQNRLYANLQKQLALAPGEAMSASTLSEDPDFRDLMAELKRVEKQIAIESARFTQESPVLQSLRDRQKELAALVNREAQGITREKSVNPRLLTFQNSTRQGLIKQLVDTSNSRQILETRNQGLLRSESSLQGQLRQLSEIVSRYSDLQSQLTIASRTLNQLLTQQQTLQIESAQKQVPWKIVADPELPRDASGNPIPLPSSTQKNVVMGLLIGLALGLGAAFIREKYRKVFCTTEDLKDALMEWPLLEVSPFNQKSQRLSTTAYANLMGLTEGAEIAPANTYLFAEAFSSLQTSMRFLAATPPIRSMVISSAEPGDGKTVIALHLAKAAALMGRRVLLIDANSYHPQLHTKLGLSNQRGLSDLLSDNLPHNDFIQRSPLEKNLFVLPAGQFTPSFTGLLGSMRMQHLMEQFQATFDLVIYDTPALLDFVDANILAGRTDGILMVVKVGKTNRSAVNQVLDQLGTYGLSMLGVVANQVENNGRHSQPVYEHHEGSRQSSFHPAGTTSPRRSGTFKTTLLTSNEYPEDPFDS